MFLLRGRIAAYLGVRPSTAGIEQRPGMVPEGIAFSTLTDPIGDFTVRFSLSLDALGKRRRGQQWALPPVGKSALEVRRAGGGASALPLWAAEIDPVEIRSKPPANVRFDGFVLRITVRSIVVFAPENLEKILLPLSDSGKATRFRIFDAKGNQIRRADLRASLPAGTLFRVTTRSAADGDGYILTVFRGGAPAGHREILELEVTVPTADGGEELPMVIRIPVEVAR